MNIWCLWRTEEDIEFSGTHVTDSCKSPCGCWDWNAGPLEEDPFFLITEVYLSSPKANSWAVFGV